jgi:hypothetical protein
VRHATLNLPWLELTCRDVPERLSTQLARALAKFAGGYAPAAVRLDVSMTVDDSGSPLEARTIDTQANVRFQFVHGIEQADAARYSTSDGSVAAIELASGQLHFTLNEQVFDAPYSTWSDLVAAPLAAAWRHHGFYPLHAAAVSFADGCAPLIIGASGTGKTTTSLALLEGGGVWRSDDKVLLHACAGTVTAASLYANTNLAPATIAAHHSLHFALARPPINDTNDKRPCLLTEVSRAVDLSPFMPTALLFPRQVSRPESALRRLDELDVLMRLSAQSPSSADRERVRRQHEHLVALARRVPAWELEAGADVLHSAVSFAGRVRATLLEAMAAV